MSIIVAVEKNNELSVAAATVPFDGRHLEPPDLVVNPDTVRRVGRSLLGFVGYGIYNNLLDHYLATLTDLPDFADRNSVFDFFLHFMDKIGQDYHFMGERGSEDDTGESPFVKLESCFLIANRQGIFVVKSGLTVTHYRKFWAIGSGCTFALGALHAAYDSDLSASEIAKCAAAAAIRFDESCRGEIKVWQVE